MSVAILGILETGWLRMLEQRAGVDVGWRSRVQARLRHGHREFGDSWRERPLAELLTNVQEEAEDIGGWGALARLALDEPAGRKLDAYTRNTVLAELEDAVELAARADAALARALAALS